jgi:16S rRNA (adenine1518-N6/adenine1519-N6)-dimethyltransferase
LSKLRGQHFLTDKNIVAKIVAAAELAGDDTVLEVGPGLGVMTRELLPRVKRLIAVELDPLFVRELKKSFSEVEPRGIEIVEADILKINIADYNLQPASYKLITNLPYNITSAFLKKFLIEPPAPERIVVMLQKEVAERIIFVRTKNQEPISKPTNLLGLMCNLYAACSPVCKVSAGSFAPPPKVDSAVICLKPYSAEGFVARWGVSIDFAEDIIAFAARFFSDPRKKMCGMLGKSRRETCKIALSAIGEDPDSRPAALNMGKWVELWKKLR